MTQLLKTIEQRFRQALASVCPEAADADPVVRVTQDPRHGDYQANGAMGLAKKLRRKPREIAQQWVERLEVDDLCEAVEIAGPGFVNVRLRSDVLELRLKEAAADARLGVTPADPARTVVVDYSSPNIAKPLHVGHLRGTIIGDAVVRVLRFVGHRVITDNHIGDWGTMFGLLIVGFQRGYADPEALQRDALGEVVRVYKQISAEAKGDRELQQQARDAVVKLQGGDPEHRRLWEQMTAASQPELESVYGKLGVRFDHTCAESFYQPMLAEVVDSLRQAGIASESDGAMCIFDPDDADAPPLIIRKSDGAFLYGTTDMAALKYRVETWRPDEIIYETDDGQRLHLSQVFKAGRRWGYDQVTLTHVYHGKVLGADGKRLKTRSGDTPRLDELLDAAVERARQVVDSQNPDLPEADRDQIAQAVGVGAVKYADLSVSRTSDYRFDLDRMLALDGNTAPYMQYAYARIQSIFRKGGVAEVDSLRDTPIELAEPAERALGLALLRLPEAVDEVLSDYRPNVLTNYLYDVAQKFSSFYESCPVLKAEASAVRQSRLALCRLTGLVIGQCLELLGIRTISQM